MDTAQLGERRGRLEQGEVAGGDPVCRDFLVTGFVM